jgi:hypothetical protein
MPSTKIILPLFLLALLSGCASPALQQAMIVKPEVVSGHIKTEQKGKFAVENVGGGKVTNPMWTSQVSREAFEGALKESLAVAGLNSEPSSAQYKIDADLLSLEQPLFGLTFDVISKVNYRVYKDGFEKSFPITAKGTATVSDAFVAIARLRMANEKSIQENITEFIKQLSASEDIK